MSKSKKMTEEAAERIRKAEEKKETKSDDGFVERAEKAADKNKGK